MQSVAEANDEGSYTQQHGSDDFAGFKDYVPGDSLKQVAWRNVAKGLPMMTKHYQSQADHQIWIDWEQFDGEDTETRLSRMCYLILFAEQQSMEYGMRLPGFSFPPAIGTLHKLQTLQALALYGQKR
ncbi:MAG: DUF58 domain-containing protein [Pseudomonadales bacterium]